MTGVIMPSGAGQDLDNEGYRSCQDAGASAVRAVEGDGQGFQAAVQDSEGIDMEVPVRVAGCTPRAASPRLVSAPREVRAGGWAQRVRPHPGSSPECNPPLRGPSCEARRARDGSASSSSPPRRRPPDVAQPGAGNTSWYTGRKGSPGRGPSQSGRWGWWLLQEIGRTGNLPWGGPFPRSAFCAAVWLQQLKLQCRAQGTEAGHPVILNSAVRAV